jgi:hypothetical protein
MNVAGTRRIAPVAIGVTIPKTPTKLTAAKTASTARTISTARITATSRTTLAQGKEGRPSDDFRNCQVFRGLAPEQLYVARKGPPSKTCECNDLASASAMIPRKTYIPRTGSSPKLHCAPDQEPEPVKETDACCPERSEGCRQLLMVQPFTKNGRYPSLRSGGHVSNFFTRSR